MAKFHLRSFLKDAADKIGPPTFSATLVACLLQNRFSLIHAALLIGSALLMTGVHRRA